jgi:hypothetical protein
MARVTPRRAPAPKPPVPDGLFDALVPCPTCRALIIKTVWVMGTSGEPGHRSLLPEPVSPALGKPHRCPGVGT